MRDWVLWFNAKGPQGLLDRPRTGRPSKLGARERRYLVSLVEASPGDHGLELIRWRRIDLAEIIKEKFDISCNETLIGRVLRQEGYSHISPRPQHPGHDGAAAAAFKKLCQPRSRSASRERRRQAH